MKLILIAAFVLVAAFNGATSLAAAAARVLIVVGPTDHPPGTHEIAAGGRVLKHCIENMPDLPGVKADVVYEWPSREQRAAATTVVFIGDTFPAHRLPNPESNMADLAEMMARGCGIVCIHYATGLLGEDVKPDGDHPLLHWLGGYFAHKSCPHHESIARIFPAAAIKPAATDHPANRGVREFTVHDEPYFRNYFGKDGNRPATNVTILATSMLPTETPKEEPVSWCVQRPDGGRGFAIVMPHFYRNWKHDDLRRAILNGIVWSAKLEAPENGVRSTLPDLATFNPENMEPQPWPKKGNAK